jgi:hypothetical protein
MSRLTTLHAAPIYCRIFEENERRYVCKGCPWDTGICIFPLKKPEHDLKRVIKELPCPDSLN